MITWPLTWYFYQSASFLTLPVQVPVPKGEAPPWCRIHQVSAQLCLRSMKKNGEKSTSWIQAKDLWGSIISSLLCLYSFMSPCCKFNGSSLVPGFDRGSN